MQIFLCYASEDRATAEQVALALIGGGFDVFFDRSNLPAGGDFHDRINAAIRNADVFVFLASADSVRSGAYTLTELKFAREKWPHPKGHLLPVRLPGAQFEELPAYLKSVTVLEPEGNVAAEVLSAVRAIKPSLLQNMTSRRSVMLVGAAGVAAGGIALWASRTPGSDPLAPTHAGAAAPRDLETEHNPATSAGAVAKKPTNPIKVRDEPAPTKVQPGVRDGEPAMRRLEKVNLSQSVGRATMVEWIADDNRRYAHLAEACLAALGGRRLRGPAMLDVVMYNYVHLKGLDSENQLPVAPQIDRELLQRALLDAYNERNHAAAKNLDEATER